MKHRYLAIGILYAFTYGSSGFGPVISASFVTHYPSVSWRGVYWLLLAMNIAAFICWTAFYFPPTFDDKHKNDENRSKMYWLKHFDWIGTFLFAAGFIVFLMGLSWGGSVSTSSFFLKGLQLTVTRFTPGSQPRLSRPLSLASPSSWYSSSTKSTHPSKSPSSLCISS